MKRISGNVNAELQKMSVAKNGIGETVKSWATVANLRGWLDLVSEQKNNTSLSAWIAQSTHVFVCDFVQLPDGLTNDNTRLVFGNEAFEVEYIDNPMNLNYQLEIYLKKSGWQNG